MTVKSIDDINVKALDGQWEGHFFLYPNSVRRDIPFEFTPPTGCLHRKDKPYTGKEV